MRNVLKDALTELYEYGQVDDLSSITGFKCDKLGLATIIRLCQKTTPEEISKMEFKINQIVLKQNGEKYKITGTAKRNIKDLLKF